MKRSYGSDLTMSLPRPAHIVGLIRQHWIRMARAFERAICRRFAVSAGRTSIKGEYLDAEAVSLPVDGASGGQRPTRRRARAAP
jgi:hypothetical protein